MELANYLHVPIATIRSYEQGSRKIDGANLKTLVRICYFFDCNITDILEDENLIEDIEDLKKLRMIGA